MKATLRSFAKINLGLRIGAAREDGFHELLTVYQTIGLHDVIKLSVERGSGVEIRCVDPRVPKDESNTCYRVAESVLRTLRAKGRVIIEIDKRLPVQGGLGGASANAVAAMLGLERVLKKSLAPTERLRIAAEVGSDLPLFLVGGTILGVGRGEQVYPLEDLPPMACVVVTPEVGVSTPKAFAQWHRLCGEGTPFGKLRAGSAWQSAFRAKADGEASSQNPVGLRGQPRTCPEPVEGAAVPSKVRLGKGKLTVSTASDRMIELGRVLSAGLSMRYSGAPLSVDSKRSRAENPLLELVRAGIMNDFEQVVFPDYPELYEAKRALERVGAKYASLSGSGSALYGLFVSRAGAARAAARLRKVGWAAQATVTLKRSQYWKNIVVGDRD